MIPNAGYEEERGWDSANFGATNNEDDAYFATEMTAAGVTVGAGVRVLDIGFGNGSFLGWCRGRGAAPHGTEINTKLVQRARLHGFTSATDPAQLVDEDGVALYDVITAFDVLEHIERSALVTFLAQIRSLCHPGTVVILRFPNGDNPFSLPLQNGDVTHMTAIGQTMMRQIATLAYFDVVRIGAPAHPRRRFGLKRALVAMGIPLRNAIGLGIRQLFMGGAPVLFCANLLVTLRPSRTVTKGCDDTAVRAPQAASFSAERQHRSRLHIPPKRPDQRPP